MAGLGEEKSSPSGQKTEAGSVSGSEILLKMERERRELIGLKLIKRKEEEHYLDLPKPKLRRES